MAYVDLPIPAGFYPKESFVKWHGEFWVIPREGSTTSRHLLPPSGANIRQVVQPPSRGVLRIICYVKYRLATVSLRNPMRDPLNVREQGYFQFGIDWPYSFSDGQLYIERYEPFTIPASGAARILTGSCLYPQFSRFRDPTTFVSTTLQLNFAAIPDETSAWSIQWPEFGGPAYTPTEADGTPFSNSTQGGYYIELIVPAPISVVGILDPGLPLSATLTYFNETDTDFVVPQLTKLYEWIKKIKASNLLPVIQNRSLRLNLQSNSSKSGNPTSNMTYAIKRAAKLRGYLEQAFGVVEIISDPQGDANARPLAGIQGKDYNAALRPDRNATISIDAGQATAALTRAAKAATP
jgi:hypothetical protein